MISIVVTGRNDDYAGGFRERLFRTCRHNHARLDATGLAHEFLLVEWNPVAGRPRLADLLTAAFPQARALVVSPDVHGRHVTNPYMPFDEMAAKNIGIRRATGEWTLVTNADILFSRDLVARLGDGGLRADALYRAHRIDVSADVADDRIESAGEILDSGEGTLPPCYYLGAGGDFCIASTRLWHQLGGFNQQVRFSTRAKDWQFFLSAAAHGVSIEFIGRVFHLDHDGGFRNTPPDERASPRAHFGGLWDIEFGLPLAADPEWGFPHLGQSDDAEGRITELAPSREEPVAPRRTPDLEPFLARVSGEPDIFSATLLHAILAAARSRCRLIVRVTGPAEAVALAGMEAVARAFDVDVRSNWVWPPLPPLTLRAFLPEPAVAAAACLVLERHLGQWALISGRSSQPVVACPGRHAIDHPAHNPMLARRLLRAWLRLQTTSARRVGVYGAGGHTRELLRWGVPDDVTIEAILVSGPGGGSINGIPIRSIEHTAPNTLDAVLLSSIPYEAEMSAAALRAGFARVLPLWSDWPPDFWRSPGEP
jgi:hypothetical protein